MVFVGSRCIQGSLCYSVLFLYHVCIMVLTISALIEEKGAMCREERCCKCTASWLKLHSKLDAYSH